MRLDAWLLGGLFVLGGGSTVLLAGCGGGDSDGHPAVVEKDDVSLPEDAVASIARLRELLKSLQEPLAAGEGLPEARPLADEIAIVADAVGEIAARSYAPDLAARMGARGKDMAKSARLLARYLRKGDAKGARTVHNSIEGVCARLEVELPKPKRTED